MCILQFRCSDTEGSIFSKIAAANFHEISRKNVFTDSDRSIHVIKNRVGKKKIEQIVSKSYTFLIQTLICITDFA